MAEVSGPFDTTTTFNESQWRKLMRESSPDGVLADISSGALAVTVGADTNSVDIAVGDARIQGSLYENTTVLNKAVSSNGAGSARPDRVLLRYDATANTIVAAVATGTAGGSIPPALTQNTAGVWEIPLARWSRAASGGAITGLIDERWCIVGGQWVIKAGIAFPTPPRTGQRLLQRDTGVDGREYRWSGAFWERVDPQPLLDVIDTGSGTTSVNTYTGGTPSGTFVGPLSGRVIVSVAADLTPTDPFSAQYAVGITGPAGFTNGPSDTNCVSLGGPSRGTKGSLRYTVTGLSPGSTYTATGYHKVSGGSGTFDRRRFLIERG